MKRIHCNPTLNADIPPHLEAVVIDAAWLEANGACREGANAQRARFPLGASYRSTREWIAEINQPEWESWLISKLGGDIATAGYYGTATAGYRGTATAGYYGTATAGKHGTATAGYYGTATAGDYGTATAGYRGTATAGEGGIIAILHRDKRRCAEVGKGGLKPNTPYKLDENGEFIPLDNVSN
jgi:hypothetical protein